MATSLPVVGTSRQKEKERAGTPAPKTRSESSTRDWHLRYEPGNTMPSPTEMEQLAFPFFVKQLAKKDYIPAEFTKNLRFLEAGQDSAPWTGYYATLRGAKLVVHSVLGIWVEIEYKKANCWRAVCLARTELDLEDDAPEGTNWPNLETTGAPVPKAKPTIE